MGYPKWPVDKLCPCVTLAHGTQGSSLRWAHGGTNRDVFAQGELSCVSAGVSQSPAHTSTCGPGAGMRLSGSTEIHSSMFVWAVLHGRELQEHRRAFKMLRKQEKYMFTHTRNYFVWLICFVGFFKNENVFCHLWTNVFRANTLWIYVKLSSSFL